MRYIHPLAFALVCVVLGSICVSFVRSCSNAIEKEKHQASPEIQILQHILTLTREYKDSINYGSGDSMYYQGRSDALREVAEKIYFITAQKYPR